jgi:hypothetical protein
MTARTDFFEYALRTDKCYAQVKTLIESKEISGWAVRETNADDGNEHVHWFLKTRIKIQALRTQFNRDIPELKGNGAYSLAAVRDVLKYVRYMAKGDDANCEPEVVWTNGIQWSSEYISDLHEQYWEENRKMKKRKAGALIDDVFDTLRDAGVEWKDRTAIAEAVLKELVARSRAINTFAVRGMVNVLSVKLCPDDSAIKVLAETCSYA